MMHQLMTRSGAALALIAVWSFTSIAQETPDFAAFRSFQPVPIGDEPVDGACVDLDGDGRLDLVSLNERSNTLSVLIGRGDGSFADQVSIAIKRFPFAMVAADLDHDGDLDLVTTHHLNRYEGIEDGLVGIHLNTGDGTSYASRYIEHEFVHEPGQIVVHDLDADGHADLIIPDGLGGCLNIFHGDGTGSFDIESVRLWVAFSGYIAADDLDLDGDLDLVATTTQSVDQTVVLLNDGHGAFETAGVYDTANNPFALDVGDVNGDGFPDVVVAVYTSGDYALLINAGDGTMQEAIITPIGDSPRDVRFCDTDLDGDLDLLVTTLGDDELRVLHNNGSGEFGAASRYGAGVEPYSIDLGDLDGDGFADVVAFDQANSFIDDYAAVLLSDRAGGFRSDTRFGDLTSRDIVFAININNDGILDLGLIDHDAQQIQLFEGRGDGGFELSAALPIGFETRNPHAVDLTASGRDDLVILNEDLGMVSVILNPATPAQVQYSIEGLATRATQIKFGDLDGDGDTDAIMSLEGETLLGVFLNDGAGQLQLERSVDTDGHEGEVVLLDNNADGDLDIVTCGHALFVFKNDGNASFNYHNRFSYDRKYSDFGVMDYDRDGREDIVLVYANASRIGIVRGKADGAMWSPLYIEMASQARTLEVCDLDLDGDDDLALLSDYYGRVSAMYNTGPFSFEESGVWMAGDNAATLIVGDATGDGQPDFITHNTGSGDLSLIENMLALTQCLPDLTHDGTLDYFDVNAFLALYFNASPEADLDQDGTLSFLDVSAFLIAFNADCP